MRTNHFVSVAAGIALKILLTLQSASCGRDDDNYGGSIIFTPEQRVVVVDTNDEHLPIDYASEETIVGIPARVTIRDDITGISRVVAGAMIHDFHLHLHLDPFNHSDSIQILGHLTIYAHDDDHDVWEMLPSDESSSDYQIEYTLQEMLQFLEDD
jgi:hypothetical protein